MNPMLRRSILAVPGDNEKMITKSVNLDADQIFLDWEDAVVSDQKSIAHATVSAFVNSDYRSRVELISIRVNAINSGWHNSDVTALSAIPLQKLFSIVLPKVTNYSELDQYSETLSLLEQAQGITSGTIKIDAQIESSTGLINVESIAQHPRVSSISFGPLDFMADLGIFTTGSIASSNNSTLQSLMDYSLIKIVLAARSAGKMAFDGPSFEIHDKSAFLASAQVSRSLGFDGKWVLHPNQIEICNEFYSPSKEEYDQAVAILDAYQQAGDVQQGSRGASLHDGVMIDEASRQIALKVVARQNAFGI